MEKLKTMLKAVFALIIVAIVAIVILRIITFFVPALSQNSIKNTISNTFDNDNKPTTTSSSKKTWSLLPTPGSWRGPLFGTSSLDSKYQPKIMPSGPSYPIYYWNQ